jgi:hypothetical protein
MADNAAALMRSTYFQAFDLPCHVTQAGYDARKSPKLTKGTCGMWAPRQQFSCQSDAVVLPEIAVLCDARAGWTACFSSCCDVRERTMAPARCRRLRRRPSLARRRAGPPSRRSGPRRAPRVRRDYSSYGVNLLMWVDQLPSAARVPTPPGVPAHVPSKLSPLPPKNGPPQVV